VGKVLTQVEKLDGSHPGVGTKVRVLLDRGIPVRKIPKMVQRQFGVSLTKDMVAYYRTNRWGPLRDRIQDESVAVKAIIEAVGGDAGVDEFMSARLLEVVHQLTHDKLIDAKELFVKVRAQNLKEQEFLFKTGQLKPGEEIDREEQSRNALRRIKEIFGLAGDEPPKPPVRQVPGAADGHPLPKGEASCPAKM